MAFHLEDSASFRAFARLPWGWSPKKVGLAQDDQRDPGGHLEAVNKMLLASARQERLESGRVVRVDSTVTAALIHEPSDSSPFVGLRAGDGSSSAAGGFAGPAPFPGTITAARREAGSGDRVYPRSPERVQHYRALLRIARNTLDYLQQAAAQLPLGGGPGGKLWQPRFATISH